MTEAAEESDMTFMGFERDQATAPFLDAAARGEFLLTRCPSCGTIGGPQEEACLACATSPLGTTTASGKASLVSWVVLHGRPGPSGGGTRVAAIGALAEGPWWWAPLLGATDDQLAEGVPLVIDYAKAGDEQLPVFRLAGTS